MVSSERGINKRGPEKSLLPSSLEELPQELNGLISGYFNLDPDLLKRLDLEKIPELIESLRSKIEELIRQIEREFPSLLQKLKEVVANFVDKLYVDDKLYFISPEFRKMGKGEVGIAITIAIIFTALLILLNPQTENFVRNVGVALSLPFSYLSQLSNELAEYLSSYKGLIFAVHLTITLVYMSVFNQLGRLLFTNSFDIERFSREVRRILRGQSLSNISERSILMRDMRLAFIAFSLLFIFAPLSLFGPPDLPYAFLFRIISHILNLPAAIISGGFNIVADLIRDYRETVEAIFKTLASIISELQKISPHQPPLKPPGPPSS